MTSTADDLTSRLAGRLRFTGRARSAVHELCSESGPQCLLVAWPGGVTALPVDAYRPGPCEVVVGHVVGCPVLLDLRQLATCPDRTVVIDAPAQVRAPRLPVLKVIDPLPVPDRARAAAVPGCGVS